MTDRNKSHAKPASNAMDKSHRTAGTDVLTLLEEDHKRIRSLFREFEKFASVGNTLRKVAVAEQLCLELMVHMRVKEEIFYPAAYENFSQPELIEETQVVHATIKELVAQIEYMVGTDALYDAKMGVLCEYVTHHMSEEEKEILPRARKCGMDLDGLGESVAFRRDELMAPMATH